MTSNFSLSGRSNSTTFDCAQDSAKPSSRNIAAKNSLRFTTSATTCEAECASLGRWNVCGDGRDARFNLVEIHFGGHLLYKNASECCSAMTRWRIAKVQSLKEAQPRRQVESTIRSNSVGALSCANLSSSWIALHERLFFLLFVRHSP